MGSGGSIVDNYCVTLLLLLVVVVVVVGYVVAQLVEVLCFQAGRWRVRFPMISLEFFIDIILPAAL